MNIVTKRRTEGVTEKHTRAKTPSYTMETEK